MRMNWHDIIKIRPELVKPKVKPEEEGDWEEVLIDQEGSSGSEECCRQTKRKFIDEYGDSGINIQGLKSGDINDMECDAFQQLLEDMLHGIRDKQAQDWIQSLLDFWDECELNKGGSMAAADYTIKV